MKVVFDFVKSWIMELPKSFWYAAITSASILCAIAEKKRANKVAQDLRTQAQDQLLARDPLGKTPDEAESDTRNHQPRLRQQARTISRAKPTIVNRAEMGQSMGQLDVIAKVRKQQYHLSAKYDDESVLECGTITNVVGQVYLMPQHFYVNLQTRKPVEIRMTNHLNPNVVLTRPYSTWIDGPVVNLTDENDAPRDLCIFAIREIHRGRDITNHFATQEDLSKMADRTFDATISGIDVESGSPVSTSHGGKCTLLSEASLHSYTMGDIQMRTTKVALHTIPTKVGDCGKVISVNSDVVTGRLFGIHISGNSSGRNHAQVISREELRSCIELLPSTAQCGSGFTNLQDTPDPFNVAFLHLGKHPISIPQASRSTITKSTLHGLIQEPLTRPAVLRPTKVTINGVEKLIDPLHEGAKKQGINCGYVDPAILESAEIDVRNLLLSQLRPDGPEPRILTTEEAIKGVPNDELFSPINRTTSPGFPYTNERKPPGFAGKTYWLGKGD